jgi:hypothetical protein
MTNRGAMIDDPAAGSGEMRADMADCTPESLEQRVHRLEDAVAALQDTHFMEERITDRVMDRLHHQQELPATGVIAAERRTRAPARDAALPDMEATTEPRPAHQAPRRRPWVIMEVFRELKTMIGMFFDTRYRVSWSAYFALMVLAYVLVSTWLWTLWAGIPVLGLLSGVMKVEFVGGILDKAVDLILALFAYKILSREVFRYRAAVAGPTANDPSYS